MDEVGPIKGPPPVWPSPHPFPRLAEPLLSHGNQAGSHPSSGGALGSILQVPLPRVKNCLEASPVALALPCGAGLSLWPRVQSCGPGLVLWPFLCWQSPLGRAAGPQAAHCGEAPITALQLRLTGSKSWLYQLRKPLTARPRLVYL